MYAIQKAETSADIYIYGDIVNMVWFDGEISAKSIVDAIKDIGEVEKIDVHIDSYGGSVSEGWAIYNALRNTKAKIRTYGDGFVASAAVFPFLAGDERIASSLSAFFLHQVWAYTKGNADELRKTADELEKMTEIGINAFVERAGMDAETVRNMMKDETWLSGQEAFDFGIATAVQRENSSLIAQSAKKNIMQRLFHEINKSDQEIKDDEKPEKLEEHENAPQQGMEEDAPKSIFDRFKSSLRKE